MHFLLLFLVSDSWLTCDSSGYSICGPQDSRISVQTNATLSNCTYIGCPGLVVTSATLTIVNVSFHSCVDDGLPFLQLVSSEGRFSETIFSNCTSEVISADGSVLAFFRVSFHNSAQSMGLMYIIATSFSCLQCESDGNGPSNAAFIAIRSNIQWDGGLIINSAGGVWVLTRSTMTVKNLVISGATAQMGAAFQLSDSSLSGYNLTVSNTSSEVQAGCFYLYRSTTVCRQCRILNCSSGGFGGVVVAQLDSTFTAIDSEIINSSAASQGGVFALLDRTLLVLSGTLIANSSAMDGAVAFFMMSSGNISSTTLIGNTAFHRGGAFWSRVSQLRLVNVSLINNSAREDGGVFYMDQQTQLAMEQGIVQGNRAESGAVIKAVGDATSSFNSTTIRGNIATETGGVLDLGGSSSATFVQDVIIEDNQAAQGNFAYISSTSIRSLVGVHLLPKITGKVFIVDTDLAWSIAQGPTRSIFPKASFHGDPSVLVLCNESFPGTDIVVNTASFLPVITVHAEDQFGNMIMADPSAPVVIRLHFLAPNSTNIIGESTKAILDATHTVEFRELRVEQPGQFQLEIEGIPGTIQPRGGSSWPQLTIVVELCNEGQRFNPIAGQCSTIRNVAVPMRIAWVALVCAFYVIVIPVLMLLFKFRTFILLKASSSTFLITVCVGATFTVSAIAFGIMPFKNSCMVAIAFDALGFVLLFGALILITFRIHKIFAAKFVVINDNRFTDGLLLRYLCALVVVMIGFLTTWFLVSPPTPEDVFYGEYVETLRCSVSSSFGLSLAAFRVILLLVTTHLAFLNRKLPSAYNESRNLAFTTYNWCVCTAMATTGNYVVMEPNARFLLSNIPQFVAACVTVALLCASKLHLCLTDPVEANRAPDLFLSPSVKHSRRVKSSHSHFVPQNSPASHDPAVVMHVLQARIPGSPNDTFSLSSPKPSGHHQRRSYQAGSSSPISRSSAQSSKPSSPSPIARDSDHLLRRGSGRLQMRSKETISMGPSHTHSNSGITSSTHLILLSREESSRRVYSPGHSQGLSLGFSLPRDTKFGTSRLGSQELGSATIQVNEDQEDQEQDHVAEHHRNSQEEIRSSSGVETISLTTVPAEHSEASSPIIQPPAENQGNSSLPSLPSLPSLHQPPSAAPSAST